MTTEWPVRIDCNGNSSDQFNAEEIEKMLREKIGAASSVSEFIEGGKKWIKVIFNNEETYKKALTMTGHSVNGTTLQFYPMTMRTGGRFAKPKAKIAKPKPGTGSRRNLYVLNLPHDLTPQDYRNLFIPHGTPTHTVLLKTHDSCSRRRGFVVMSTHEEAQEVIKWLDGICIRGFQLRVTWANIDRSNGEENYVALQMIGTYGRNTLGFLSGYDRPHFENPSTCGSVRTENRIMGLDTSTIVASNIPVALFPASEVDILFKPFGQIKRIEIVPPNPPATYPLATLAPASPLAQTAIVTYDNHCNAIAAKNTLHGQIYEGFTLAVGFVFNLDQEKESHDKPGAFAYSKTPLGVSTNTFPRYISDPSNPPSNVSHGKRFKNYPLLMPERYLSSRNENAFTTQVAYNPWASSPFSPAIISNIPPTFYGGMLPFSSA